MLLIITLWLFAVSPALSVPVKEPCTTGRNKLLLISFDGFRWDYDRDVDTPNLDRMAQDGVKATYVTPPYITITSLSHFTLLTGELKDRITVRYRTLSNIMSVKNPLDQIK